MTYIAYIPYSFPRKVLWDRPYRSPKKYRINPATVNKLWFRKRNCVTDRYYPKERYNWIKANVLLRKRWSRYK